MAVVISSYNINSRIFFYFLKKRSVLCFAIGFYLLNLLIVNNFSFDIGHNGGTPYFSFIRWVAMAVAFLSTMGWDDKRGKNQATGNGGVVAGLFYYAA